MMLHLRQASILYVGDQAGAFIPPLLCPLLVVLCLAGGRNHGRLPRKDEFPRGLVEGKSSRRRASLRVA